MLSLGKVASASAAGRYFERDDYYARDGESPSAWLGEGAARLGLAGSVEKETFAAVLEGRVPGSDQVLGTLKDGERVHGAGWDLTFSAPKSVSILAEVMGDTRLIRAHDAAVRAAIAHVEERHATTRLREGRGVVARHTGSLVVAAFRHDLSRNGDPQLHTHAVVANMTATDRGWRSLHSPPLYAHKMAVGALYRQELAMRVRGLGYGVEAGSKGSFEIAGVEAGLRAAFSTRRAEIEEKLRAYGVEPEKAGGALAAVATLATRRRKAGLDRDRQGEIWRAALGPAAERSLAGLMREAEGRARDGAMRVSPAAERAGAEQALERAVAVLGEREAAITETALIEKAGELGLGETRRGAIEAALRAAIKDGRLIARGVRAVDAETGRDRVQPGVTTAAAERLERGLLRHARDGQGALAPLATPTEAAAALAAAERASAAAGHGWTEDQRRAALGLLTGRDRLHGVQGHAGTAKTTTVLATYARVAAESGRNVVALAPTASAAATLGAALGREGRTVAGHLAGLRQALDRRPETAAGRPEQVWIVDEASMLGTRDLVRLARSAAIERARLVLVGDARQLGSVEAGAGFRQLQAGGMATERLATIVRQRDPDLQAAVTLAAEGAPAAALARFQEGSSGALVEADTREARIAAVAEAWLGLSPAERERTIVIDPSRAGRAAVNAAIRSGLIAEGRLGEAAATAGTLADRGLTAAERRLAASYAVGDVVRFGRDLTLSGERVAKGGYASVTAVDAAAGRLTLATAEGRALDWRPGEKGASRSGVYAVEPAELRAGDRLVWTRNDPGRGLVNGAQGTVERVDPLAREAVVRFGEGEGVCATLALDRPGDGHWRHAYAETAHAAQGRTADRVIVHAEASRLNLVHEAGFYVALSRAREAGTLVTDDRARLGQAIAGRAGRKETALDRPGPAPERAASPTPARTVAEGRESARPTPTHERTAEATGIARKAERQPILPGLDDRSRPSPVSEPSVPSPPPVTPAAAATAWAPTAEPRPASTPRPADASAVAEVRPVVAPVAEAADRLLAGERPEVLPGREADPAIERHRPVGTPRRERDAGRDRHDPDRAAREREAGWTPADGIRTAADIERAEAYYRAQEAREAREDRERGLDRDDGPGMDR